MRTAKLFTNGRSQAVRLPKDCRFSGGDVYITKVEGIVMLIPKAKPWASLIGSLDRFTDDFMGVREQPRQEERDEL
jgi:antitoxin VapB